MDMASTTATTTALPSPMDSSALRFCGKCHRRMSSLKYDLHTVCSQCREVICSVTTRCDECRAWSIDVMTDYLKHKKSLATKSKKKSVTSASIIPPAVVSSPLLGSPSRLPSVSDDAKIRDTVLSAVASSPLLGSPSRLPSVSDDAKIRDTVLSVLHALSQSGSVDNPFSFSAPSSVPGSVPPIKEGPLEEMAATSPI